MAGQTRLPSALFTHLFINTLREGEQYINNECLYSGLLAIQASGCGDGAYDHVQRHQHVGHASVPELESSPTQQLRQHGAQQTQRADAYIENHAALRRGAHVSMHPPWLQQDTAQLLQHTHTRIQTLAREQLDPCKAPLKIPLLTCCEEEDEGGKDV